MDNLYIEARRDSPKVDFNFDSGQLLIHGQSFPESSPDFYKPVIEWVYNFAKGNSKKIFMNFKLTYFNTSSSKAILDILDILEHSFQKGNDVQMNWFYEPDDEDIKESGEEFHEDLELPFSILENK